MTSLPSGWQLKAMEGDMKFAPLEPGNNTFPVVPSGTYSLTVGSAEETTSKSGNPMIKLKLNTLSPDGEAVVVFDHLVATAAAIWMIEQFCLSAGLMEKYETGELTALDCEGVEVQAELGIEQDPKFGERNVVKKYVGTPQSRVP
jgi:hypothetical protein